MTGRDNRIEVVSVVKRHHQRSWAQKARIVSEAEAPGSSFVAAATRHGVQPAQIYTWRKLLRNRAEGAAPVRLAAVQLIGTGPEPALPHMAAPVSDAPSGARRDIEGTIDVSIGGTITVRISGHVGRETLTTVLRTLTAYASDESR
jgi:transposase-like protein